MGRRGTIESMEFLLQCVDLFVHLDAHIANVVASYGTWVYAIVFLVIFCETGLVVTPFLPGDSLLFALGALAATGSLSIGVLFVLVAVAAILGDASNYALGSRLGKRFETGNRLIKKEYLEKTRAFYDRYGAKTIVIARFMPIVRTFAPFVAGIGRMKYSTFSTYNVVGALLWATIFLGAGYVFGNIPFVKDNFSIVILVIIALSVTPGVIEYLKERTKKTTA